MAATITVRIGQEGQMTISVIDLIGDLWSDFRYFVAEAAATAEHGDLHARNRNLRVALVCLMAHTEGVVSGITEKMEHAASDVASRGAVDTVADLCFTRKVEALRRRG